MMIIVVFSRVHRKIVGRVRRARALPRAVVKRFQRRRCERLQRVDGRRNGRFQWVRGRWRNNHADNFGAIFNIDEMLTFGSKSRVDLGQTVLVLFK